MRYITRCIPGNQSELPVMVVICARKDTIVLAGWIALLVQRIEYVTTDHMMSVRIVHGVQNFLATTLESLLSGNLIGKYRDVVNGRWCCRTMGLRNEQTGMDNFCRRRRYLDRFESYLSASLRK